MPTDNLKVHVELLADGKALIGQTQKSSKEVKGLGQQANTTSQQLKSLTGQIEKMTAAIGAMVIAADVARHVKQLESSLFVVRAELGITQAEAQKFADIGRDIYTDAWGKSLEQTTTAVTEVTKRFADMGEIARSELQSAATNVVALSERFDEKQRDTVDMSAALVKELGLTIAESQDWIAYAFQRGLNGADDLALTITEYASHFRQADGSALDFLNTLIDLQQYGTAGLDYGVDALKEFQIRVFDGSQSTRDAFAMLGMDVDAVVADLNSGATTVFKLFQQMAQRLTETTDKSIQMQAGFGLMGAKFEDLTADVVARIGATSVSFDDLAGSMEHVLAANETTSAKVTRAWRTVMVMLAESDMAQGIATAIGQAADAITHLAKNAEELAPLVRIIGVGGALWAGSIIAPQLLSAASVATGKLTVAITQQFTSSTANAKAQLKMTQARIADITAVQSQLVSQRALVTQQLLAAKTDRERNALMAQQTALTHSLATAQTQLTAATAANTAAQGELDRAARKSTASIMSLETAGYGLMAAYVGYEIGSYLYEEFEIARVAGARFIEAGLIGIVRLQQGYAYFAADFKKRSAYLAVAFEYPISMMQDMFFRFIGYIAGRFTSFISTIGSVVSYIPGFDEGGAQIQSYAAKLEQMTNAKFEAITANNQFTREYEAMAADIDASLQSEVASHEAAIAEIRDITNQQVDDIITGVERQRKAASNLSDVLKTIPPEKPNTNFSNTLNTATEAIKEAEQAANTARDAVDKFWETLNRDYATAGMTQAQQKLYDFEQQLRATGDYTQEQIEAELDKAAALQRTIEAKEQEIELGRKSAEKLADMGEELMLLQMTTAEQEEYNRLKGIAPEHVDAAKLLHEQIEAQKEVNQLTEDMQSAYDDAYSSMSQGFETFIGDLLSGTANASDALGSLGQIASNAFSNIVQAQTKAFLSGADPSAIDVPTLDLSGLTEKLPDTLKPLGDSISSLTNKIEGTFGAGSTMGMVGIGANLMQGNKAGALSGAMSLAGNYFMPGIGGAIGGMVGNVLGGSLFGEWEIEAQHLTAAVKDLSATFQTKTIESKSGIGGSKKRVSYEAVDSETDAELQAAMQGVIDHIEFVSDEIGQALTENFKFSHVIDIVHEDTEDFAKQFARMQSTMIKNAVTEMEIIGVDDSITDVMADKVQNMMKSAADGLYDKAFQDFLWRPGTEKYADAMRGQVHQGLNDLIAATDWESLSFEESQAVLSEYLTTAFSEIGVDVPPDVFDQMATDLASQIQEGLQWLNNTEGLVDDDAAFFVTLRNMTEQFNEWNAAPEDVAKFVSELLLLKDAMKLAGFESQQISQSLVETAGGAGELNAGLSAFYGNFLTEEEKRQNQLAILSNDLNKEFAELGVQFPETSDQFKQMVQDLGADLSTLEAQTQFAGLVELSADMAQYFELLEEQPESTEVAKDALQLLSEEMEKLPEKIKSSDIAKTIEELYETSSSREEMGEKLADSIGQQVRDSVMSTIANSVANMMLSAVITPMLNATMVSATTDIVSAINAGDELITAGEQTSDAITQAGNNAGNSMDEGGERVKEALGAGADAAKISLDEQLRQMEQAAEVMSDPENQDRMKKVFEAMRGPIEQIGAATHDMMSGMDGFLPSASQATQGTTDLTKATKNATKAAEDAAKAEEELAEKRTAFNTQIQTQIDRFYVTGLQRDLLSLQDRFAKTTKEAEELGADLVAVERLREMEIAKVRAEYAQKTLDFNQDIQAQIDRFNVGDLQLALLNLDDKFNETARKAEEMGADLVAVERLREMEIAKVRAEYAQKTLDFNQDIQAQIDRFDVGDLRLALLNLDDKFNETARKAEEMGADLVAVERLREMEIAKVRAEYAQKTLAFNQDIQIQIDRFDVGDLESALWNLQDEFENTVKEAEQVGGDIVAIEKLFSMKRTQIVEEHNAQQLEKEKAANAAHADFINSMEKTTANLSDAEFTIDLLNKKYPQLNLSQRIAGKTAEEVAESFKLSRGEIEQFSDDLNTTTDELMTDATKLVSALGQIGEQTVDWAHKVETASAMISSIESKLAWIFEAQASLNQFSTEDFSLSALTRGSSVESDAQAFEDAAANLHEVSQEIYLVGYNLAYSASGITKAQQLLEQYKEAELKHYELYLKQVEKGIDAAREQHEQRMTQLANERDAYQQQADDLNSRSDSIADMIAEISNTAPVFETIEGELQANLNARLEQIETERQAAMEASQAQLDALEELRNGAAELSQSLRSDIVQLQQEVNGTTVADRLATAQLRFNTTQSPQERIEAASELRDLTLENLQEQIKLAEEKQAVERDTYKEWLDYQERLRDYAADLRGFVDDLLLGENSPLTNQQRLAEAEHQYTETLRQAKAGDEQAIAALQEVASTYLDEARGFYASSDDYTQIFNSVTGAMTGMSNHLERAAQQNAPKQLDETQFAIDITQLQQDALTQLGRLDSEMVSLQDTLAMEMDTARLSQDVWEQQAADARRQTVEQLQLLRSELVAQAAIAQVQANTKSSQIVEFDDTAMRQAAQAGYERQAAGRAASAASLLDRAQWKAGVAAENAGAVQRRQVYAVQQQMLSSYGVGSPDVPEDGPAYVHKGEIIIPPDESETLRKAGIKVKVGSGDNAESEALLAELVKATHEVKQELARIQQGQKQQTKELSKAQKDAGNKQDRTARRVARVG